MSRAGAATVWESGPAVLRVRGRVPPTVAFRGPKVWLWRWRRNPLSRRGDRMESWVLLVAWTLTLFGGVAAGLVAADSVESGLARQRAEWRQVGAVLTEDAPEPAGTSSTGTEKVWAKVRWT